MINRILRAVGVLLFCSLIFSRSFAQPIGVPVPPLGEGPWAIETAEHPKICLLNTTPSQRAATLSRMQSTE